MNELAEAAGAGNEQDNDQDRVIPIYIMAGQSNAMRMGTDAAVMHALGQDTTAFEFIKLALGKTGLESRTGADWSPLSTGELYDALLAEVKDRMAYVVAKGFIPKIAGIFWLQGEADAGHEFLAQDYLANLTTFITHLRSDLGTDMPFVLTEMHTDSILPYRSLIRAAQEQAVAEISDVTALNNDDLFLLPDGVHFTEDSRVKVASRFVDIVHAPTASAATAGYVGMMGPHLYRGTAGADTLDYRGNDSTISNDFRDLTILAGAGDDVIGTGAGNNKVYGEDGNDRVLAWFGDDRIYGGAGNDTLYGSYNPTQYLSPFDPAHPWQLDNDTIDGGAGDDLISDLVGNNVVFGGVGNDRITLGYGADLIRGDDGDDTIDAGSGADRVFGGNGKDVLSGAAGDDQMCGDGGDDVLTAGEGNDRLDGGAGADIMSGEAGDDTYIVDSAGDMVRETAGNGTDMIQSSLSWTIGDNVENLLLTGTASVSATGNGLDNRIYGNAGDNGLYGGAGVDMLSGGAGNDTLDGGTGNDRLYGGAGADIFVFLAASGHDSIGDFSAAAGDWIDLHARSAGVVHGGGIVISQHGADTIIRLGADIITVAGAWAADVESHIIW